LSQQDGDRRTEAEVRMQEALGPEIGSDAVVAAGEVARKPASSTRPLLIVLAAAVVLLVVSFILVPPYGIDAAGKADPNKAFAYPGDAIKANFELPIPHVAFDLDPSTPIDHHSLVTWDLTISSSLLTGWIVMAVIIVLAVILSRSISLVPRRGQNALEYAYEGLANFATSLGGPGARRYVPVFVTFFLYILLSNWSGLLPFVGRTEQLRAPTSDVNMTIGLALISFFMFHIEGVRVLGFRGYFGKFFTLKGGPIGLFVGVLEFFLEFVKPVTLSMRLFGNIYAGEIALGVITGLTFVIIPVAMVGLEFLLNFMQALIFSVLTLMFTLIAVEGHDEEHAEGHEAASEHLPEGNVAPNAAGA
jgi:F-type H+-transporting ATPase subunit a